MAAAATAPRDHAQGDLPEEIVFRGCNYNLDKFATEYIKNKEALINLLSGKTLIPCGRTGNWSDIALSYNGTHIVACQCPGYIYTSSDSGDTWTEREQSRNWVSVASSRNGKNLVACEYNGHIYTSSDFGATWTQRGEPRIWMCIASSETGDNLVACEYGGHIYTSSNSGETWTQRGHSSRWRSVASSYDGSKLCACEMYEDVYTSSDFGATWTLCKDVNFFTDIASSKDGIKLVACGQIQERGDNFVYISSDAGENWMVHVVASVKDCSVTGVALSHDGAKLVVCCEKNIYISSDSGNTWTIYKQGVREGRLSNVRLSGDGNKLCVFWSDGHSKIQILMSQTGCVPLPVPISLENKSCCVCFETYNIESADPDTPHIKPMYIKPCGHTICKNCSDMLLTPKCPTCRVDIYGFEEISPLQLDGYPGKKIFWGGANLRGGSGYKKIRTKRA
jgi:photosystem II stability/assembly factor-like uncharacterized protein